MFPDLFEEASFFESKLATISVEVNCATLLSPVAAFIELEDFTWHATVLKKTSESQAARSGSDDCNTWRHSRQLKETVYW